MNLILFLVVSALISGSILEYKLGWVRRVPYIQKVFGKPHG